MATNNNGNFGQENREDQQWNDNQDASNSTLNQNLNPRETDRTRYDDAESSAEQRMNDRNSDREWNSDDLSATDRKNEVEQSGFETAEDLDDDMDSDSDQDRSGGYGTNRNESL